VILIGLAGSVVFYALFGVATVWRSIAWLFVARIGAGIAGATISTAQAYIADTTPLDKRTKGMALIGAAFGLGFTFGPLFGALTLQTGETAIGPEPGYAAAALSAVALVLAWFKLPESLSPESASAARKRFDRDSLRAAVATPTVGALLLTLFICVASFSSFEATLSLFLYDEESGVDLLSVAGDSETLDEVALDRAKLLKLMYLFAYIGIVLSLVQGGIVRRLATRVSEIKLAATGAVIEMIGFIALPLVRQTNSLPLVMVVLAVLVSGFAFLMPSINSLISRRSDPAQQGGILGLAQSASALARIIGPVLGNVLLAYAGIAWPYWVAAALMGVGLLLVLRAAGGKDFGAA
jgi:MFS family permease